MKKLLLSLFIITMVASCSSDTPVSSNVNGQITKTIQKDESGFTTTLQYSYQDNKIVEVKGIDNSLGIITNYLYTDNKLVRITFNAILVEGYQSFIYTGDLITKSEKYNSIDGKVNITYKYNSLNQIEESTQLDENNVTTITKYTYDSNGNKKTAKTGTSTIYYEYDDKINPTTSLFSKVASMATGNYANNLAKETDGSDITTYIFTYNSEGKPITEKTYEQGKLVSTFTYFYN